MSNCPPLSYLSRAVSVFQEVSVLVYPAIRKGLTLPALCASRLCVFSRNQLFARANASRAVPQAVSFLMCLALRQGLILPALRAFRLCVSSRGQLFIRG